MPAAQSRRLDQGVVLKLFLASLCMVTVPILVFFAFHSWGLAEAVLGDESKYKMALSGGMAAGAVNVILIVYVIMALMEDAKGGQAAATTAKKKE
jgi:hypothetical protein